MNWNLLGWTLVFCGAGLLRYGMTERTGLDGAGELFVRFPLPVVVAAVGAGLVWPVWPVWPVNRPG